MRPHTTILLLMLMLSSWSCKRTASSDAGMTIALLLASAPTTAASTAISAAAGTASTNASCTSIAPFYWEIGDEHGSLGSGSVDTGTGISASTKMPIASASKWIWGAYVLQRYSGTSDDAITNSTTRSYLQMTAGYTNFSDTSCGSAASVHACADMTGTDGDHTNVYVNAGDAGKFHYGGGHFQAFADTTAGLGSLGDTLLHPNLANEIMSQVGTDTGLFYASPQPAGGVYANAVGYAAFLRRILNRSLVMGSHLGEDAICTLPAKCPGANYSPFPEDVHYSYGHWVEDSPGNDGAFSSPGKFGFYPWIDSTKTYYGILARQDSNAGAYYASIVCGRLIRKAFLTGVVQ